MDGTTPPKLCPELMAKFSMSSKMSTTLFRIRVVVYTYFPGEALLFIGVPLAEISIPLFVILPTFATRLHNLQKEAVPPGRSDLYLQY